ncbi:MAG: glucokinase [Gammaproteobacteria bacterium]|nr:glucokinase [Gammaproteobacteria bacterium]MBU1654831.1 glucokinase [Gammaproteobacteria bacterium]MBU1961098.1 glucokinase [Gammaproteobacteria bacterium]
MPETLILAGDIGGTKSALGLFRGTPEAPRAVFERIYANREFSGLEMVIVRFLSEAGLPASSACFGVAGAVLEGGALLPNLGWRITEAALARDLELESVRLINDLEANALGIATLEPEQLFSLNDGGLHPGGNRALIAAGTGLGMALMVPDTDGWRVLPSEGGHADFAPNSEQESALWRFLKERHGHVSLERVLSGSGLVNVYQFLRHSGLAEPDWLARRFQETPDPAAVIARAGLAGDAAICAQSLDIFLAAYGAAAGNLALTALATGGVYLGGGIAPRLVEALPRSSFLAAFADKGRFAALLREVPVQVIIEPKCALFGAAAHALRLEASG